MRTIQILAAAAVVAALPALALSSRAAMQAVDPATYRSLGGEFSLFVDPSHFQGAGPGLHVLKRGDEEVWSATLDYTLRGATVTDAGEVVAFGYTNGEEPAYLSPGRATEYGDLVLVILNTDGTTRMEQPMARGFCGYTGSLPGPFCGPLLANTTGDWAMFTTYECPHMDHPGGYHVYRLSTGEFVHTLAAQAFPGAAEGIGKMFNTMLILDGTPYVVTESRSYQTRVAQLLNPLEGVVWSRTFPAAPYRQEVGADLPLLVSVGAGGRFDLLHADTSEQVVYTLTGATGVETPMEVSRSAFSPPPRTTTESRWMRAEDRTLEFLGEIPLQLGAVPENLPIRNVVDFVVDGAGNFAFVRSANRDQPSEFVLMDGEENLLAEMVIPIEGFGRGLVADIGGGLFALLGGGGRGSVYIVADTNSMTFEEPVVLDYTSALSLSVFSNGDLLALTSKHHRYSITETLWRLRSNGDVVWSKETGGMRVREDFWQAKHADVFPGDQVGVLRLTSRDIQFFDGDGGFLRLLSLEEPWGRRPNYTTDIFRAPEGGFLIRDFNGPHRVVVCNEDGSIRREFTFRDAGGYTFDSVMKYGPDGSLWALNGNAFHCIDAEGLSVAHVGHVPDADSVTQILHVAVRRDGRIHLMDRHTRQVFVFDEAGTPLHQCMPDPEDFRPNVSGVSFSFMADGGFGVSDDMHSGGVRFSSTGERVGPYSRGGYAGRHALWPDGSHQWLVEYRAVKLQDMDGTTIAEVNRDARRNWLNGISNPVVAPDGSLAVSKSFSGEILLFAADGSPTAVVNAPGYGTYSDYDGEWIARPAEGVVYLTRADGSECHRLRIDKAEGNWPRPFLLPEIGELWTWDGKSLALQRWKLQHE